MGDGASLVYGRKIWEGKTIIIQVYTEHCCAYIDRVPYFSYLRASTLMGLNQENPALDPLAVKHLNNWLYLDRVPYFSNSKVDCYILLLCRALQQSDIIIKCGNKNQPSVLYFIFKSRELSLNVKDLPATTLMGLTRLLHF